LERGERKFLENRERKKMVGCHDINNKNDHIWYRQEEFDGDGFFFKVLIHGVI